jgi:hypothetical protein
MKPPVRRSSRKSTIRCDPPCRSAVTIPTPLRVFFGDGTLYRGETYGKVDAAAEKSQKTSVLPIDRVSVLWIITDVNKPPIFKSPKGDREQP